MVSPILIQTWSVSAVLLNMITYGMILGYPSSLLHALKDPHSSIQVDINMASWIVSSIGICSVPGIFLSSYLMDAFGRKVAQVTIILPGILGWICICLANNATTILIGRIIGALTAGGCHGIGAAVIGEYTSPGNRGMFLNFKTATVYLGSMIIHILGNYFHWRTVAWLSLTPLLISLLISLTWTESPSWLAFKHDFDKCKKSFFFLRGENRASIKELNELIAAQMNRKLEDVEFKQKILGLFKKFSRINFRRPLIIFFVATVLLEAAGKHIFPVLALDIVSEVVNSKTQSFYFTLGVDVIITISSTFSCLLARIVKRRVLLFTTGFAAAAVLAITCTHLFLASRDIISKDYNWIPMSTFVLFFILVNLGCAPLPIVLAGEIFPLEHRAAALVVAISLASIKSSIALHSAVFLLDSMKVYGTFAILALGIVVCLGVLYFILPETKDKTLQEIEDYMDCGFYRKENALQKCDEGSDEEYKNILSKK